MNWADIISNLWCALISLVLVAVILFIIGFCVFAILEAVKEFKKLVDKK